MYVSLQFSKIKARGASISSVLHPVKPPNGSYSEFFGNLSVCFFPPRAVWKIFLPISKTFFKLSVYMGLVVLFYFFKKAFLFLQTLAKIKCSR